MELNCKNKTKRTMSLLELRRNTNMPTIYISPLNDTVVNLCEFYTLVVPVQPGTQGAVLRGRGL